MWKTTKRLGLLSECQKGGLHPYIFMCLSIRKESLNITESNGEFLKCGQYLYVYLFYVLFWSLQIISICSKSLRVDLYWEVVLEYGDQSF